MPMVVECPYCARRARVPEYASGRSGKCSRCASYFTLCPADDQRMPEATTTIAEEAEPAPMTGSVATAIAEAEASRPIEANETPEPLPEKKPHPRGPALVGAAALFLGGLALAFITLAPLCRFVIPLGILGFLLGIVAILLAWNTSRARKLLPIAGMLTPGLVAMIAWLAPAGLGPTYQLSRQRGATVATGPIAIPLDDAPALSETPEWTDASRYALQRGEVRIEVVHVRIDAPPTDDAAKVEPGLHVRLRVAVAPSKLRVSLDPYTVSVDRSLVPLDGVKAPKPTLLANDGQSLPFRDRVILDSVGGKRRAHLFPGHANEEVVTFALPSAGFESLRFEIAGEAWGANGPFRFAIPASMVEQKKKKAN